MDHAAWTLPSPEDAPEFYEDVLSKRLLAWVVDIAVIFMITLVILPFTFFIGLFFLPVLVMAVSFVYRVATLASGSATWGMRLMAIELRTAQGARFDFATALLHTTGYAISIAMPLIQAGSIALMLSSRRKQGLSDHLLGTVALNCRNPR